MNICLIACMLVSLSHPLICLCDLFSFIGLFCMFTGLFSCKQASFVGVVASVETVK